MQQPASHPRGFTLIEMLVVLGIVAVVSALGIAALDKLKGSGNFNSGASDVISALRKTRAEAFARGEHTAFVIDTVNHRWWSLEVAADFSLDTFNPAAPGTVYDSGTLPTAVRFGPVGYGLALPAPFSGIPTQTTQSPNLIYCSFCRTMGTNAGLGFVLFQPGGQVEFSGGPAVIGQQFVLRGNADGVERLQAVAVIAATGLTETFLR